MWGNNTHDTNTTAEYLAQDLNPGQTQLNALYDVLLSIDPLNANLLFGLCKGILYDWVFFVSFFVN